PGVQIIEGALTEDAEERSLEFDVTNVTGWDSRLVALMNRCAALCRVRNINFRSDSLPEGVRRLLRLANTVPEKKDARQSAPQAGFLPSLGDRALVAWEGAHAILVFLGENAQAFVKLVRGRAQFRWSDALLVMQECGPQALGIVALINCLV